MIIHGKVYDCNGFLVDHPGHKHSRQNDTQQQRDDGG